ncbi:MAG TPA: penicillin acylase family protein [Gammaproteobacteria bacterium]|nr:penicillin acylase family protein [Gammaproteobacteria bacterium]
MRRLAIGFGIALGVVCVAGGLYLRQAFVGSLPLLEGERSVAGLSAPVRIERDMQGVPVLRAGNRRDLAFASGFVHAQERFFQMDLLRRDAAGELAALVGAAALERDKARRPHLMRQVARAVVANAAEEDRALLAAYVAGVNAGLAALAADPWEYWLLGEDPAPWSAEDSVLVVLAMYFELQDENGTLDAARGLVHEVLPEAMYRFLVQRGSSWDAPLVGALFPPQLFPAPDVYDLRRLEGVDFEPARFALHEAEMNVAAGSNNWAASGKRTPDGRAILANDMHLPHGVPNIWYRARLVVEDAAGPLDVTGVMLPGLPFIVAGSNGRVAWGFTNSYGDWTDLAVLTLDPAGKRYLTPDGYEDFIERRETIEIAGGRDVELVVKLTRWGPVFEDESLHKAYAVRWLAHFPEATNTVLGRLERARDVQEALAIANESGIPPQNFVVADAEGRIGWTIMGRIPRRSGDYDPALPADWSKGGGWEGWLEPGEYPRIIDPPGGYLWTANARTVDGDWLALLGDGGYDLGARAQQIRDALFAHPRVTERDMLAIQLDDRALFLERWRDLLLDVLTPEAVAADPRRGEFRRLVEEWGGRAAIDSAGYRLVRAWRTTLHDAVFAALTAEVRKRAPEFRYRDNQSEAALWQLVTARPPHLLSPRYSSWEEQMLAAVDATIAHFAELGGTLAERTWGERNTLAARHPLSRAMPLLGHWLDMPAVPLPGDANMPRVQAPAFGASERFVVSPGREQDGYFHMPVGQSAHPLSPYFGAGHDDWVRGEPAPFLPGAAHWTLTLVPAERNIGRVE